MNSEPSFRYTGMVTATASRLSAMVARACASTKRQGPADGVALLRVVLAHERLRREPGERLRAEPEGLDAREQHAHGGIERHREQGGDRHGQVLRVGERPEQAALLIDQRE